jgi:hypothetical protein
MTQTTPGMRCIPGKKVANPPAGLTYSAPTVASSSTAVPISGTVRQLQNG